MAAGSKQIRQVTPRLLIHGHAEGVYPPVTTSLDHPTQGYEGRTPYVAWGNGAVLALCGLLIGLAWVARHRK